ncbi:MAG: UbiX family flavin prenyltransferase [Chloroflexi bacterium]|nr:UbiX family flavin prenyltransferase [Chloroflexota bacterium]
MGGLPIIIGITGGSGAAIAKRCIELLTAHERPVLVVCTPAGQRVWQHEVGTPLRQWLRTTPARQYPIGDVAAPIASGTYPTGGMAVVPCSMNTLAAIAHGLSTNLLERAADVILKESRPLVLVPRETPLSVIHLTNLLTLARLGVKIVPPMPPFYARPTSMDEVIEHIAARVLVALGVTSALPYDQQYGNGLH